MTNKTSLCCSPCFRTVCLAMCENTTNLSMNIARNKIDNDSSVSMWHPARSIIYSCIDIYAYSCLKLLSNWPEAIFKQQNRSSNQEICVLFEHSFYLNMHTADLTFFQWHCFVLCRCSFQTFVKNFVSVNVTQVLAQNRSLFYAKQNGQHSRLSISFRWVFTFFMLFSVIFSTEIIVKMQE